MKIFNSIILLLVLPLFSISQNNVNNGNKGHYDVMTFVSYDQNFGNGGITIRTQIPDNIAHNTILYIKGFDNTGNTIGYQLSWFYIYDAATSQFIFSNATASSTGSSLYISGSSFFLGTNGGKIYISTENYFTGLNLEVTAFCDIGVGTSQWFNDWDIDNAFTTGQEVHCFNKFGAVTAANIYSEGSLNGANSTITGNLNVGQGINTGTLATTGDVKINGRLAIGSTITSTTASLHTTGGVRFEGLKHNTDDQVLSTDANGNLKLVSKGAYWTPHTNASTIVYNGTVGIGITSSTVLNTTSNPPYKLVVGGKIGATKIRVTELGWADYVFAKDYKLQPLTEVEKFIKKNGHLPEVPTTQEVKDNGVDLGDTQVILLKKIEELTLHLIELNKKLEWQNKKIKKLESVENNIQIQGFK